MGEGGTTSKGEGTRENSSLRRSSCQVRVLPYCAGLSENGPNGFKHSSVSA